MERIKIRSAIVLALALTAPDPGPTPPAGGVFGCLDRLQRPV